MPRRPSGGASTNRVPAHVTSEQPDRFGVFRPTVLRLEAVDARLSEIVLRMRRSRGNWSALGLDLATHLDRLGPCPRRGHPARHPPKNKQGKCHTFRVHQVFGNDSMDTGVAIAFDSRVSRKTMPFILRP